jgi:hypothetical protein
MKQSPQIGVGPKPDINEKPRIDPKAVMLLKANLHEEYAYGDIDADMGEDDENSEAMDQLEESTQSDAGESNDDLSGHNSDQGIGAESEPPNQEDYGDSDRFLSEGDSDSTFHPAQAEGKPFASMLPARARPIIRFAIDTNYLVRPLDANIDAHFQARKLLAEAVALHLKNHRVEFNAPGDWCQIPAIKGNDELLRLVASVTGDSTMMDQVIKLRIANRNAAKAKRKAAGSSETELLGKCSQDFRGFELSLSEVGAQMKQMGISLPNREVVTVAMLMEKTFKDKDATLGGALRNAHTKPSSLAGSEMTEKCWKDFERELKRSENAIIKRKAKKAGKK